MPTPLSSWLFLVSWLTLWRAEGLYHLQDAGFATCACVHGDGPAAILFRGEHRPCWEASWESLFLRSREFCSWWNTKVDFPLHQYSLLLNRTSSLFCISSQLFWLFRLLILSAVVLRRWGEMVLPLWEILLEGVYCHSQNLVSQSSWPKWNHFCSSKESFLETLAGSSSGSWKVKSSPVSTEPWVPTSLLSLAFRIAFHGGEERRRAQWEKLCCNVREKPLAFVFPNLLWEWGLPKSLRIKLGLVNVFLSFCVCVCVCVYTCVRSYA